MVGYSRLMQADEVGTLATLKSRCFPGSWRRA
jgi:hypothetical protein